MVLLCFLSVAVFMEVRGIAFVGVTYIQQDHYHRYPIDISVFYHQSLWLWHP